MIEIIKKLLRHRYEVVLFKSRALNSNEIIDRRKFRSKGAAYGFAQACINYAKRCGNSAVRYKITEI